MTGHERGVRNGRCSERGAHLRFTDLIPRSDDRDKDAMRIGGSARPAVGPYHGFTGANGAGPLARPCGGLR